MVVGEELIEPGIPTSWLLVGAHADTFPPTSQPLPRGADRHGTSESVQCRRPRSRIVEKRLACSLLGGVDQPGGRDQSLASAHRRFEQVPHSLRPLGNLSGSTTKLRDVNLDVDIALPDEQDHHVEGKRVGPAVVPTAVVAGPHVNDGVETVPASPAQHVVDCLLARSADSHTPDSDGEKSQDAQPGETWPNEPDVGPSSCRDSRRNHCTQRQTLQGAQQRISGSPYALHASSPNMNKTLPYRAIRPSLAPRASHQRSWKRRIDRSSSGRESTTATSHGVDQCMGSATP